MFKIVDLNTLGLGKEFPENIYFIQRGWMDSNNIIIKGNPNVIIDTSYCKSEKETESIFSFCGMRAEDLDMIVNTHNHADHTGGNNKLQSLSDAKIAMHEYDAHYVNLWDESGLNLDFSAWELPKFSVDNILTDGDILSFPPFDFKVIHSPGHSGGNIVLYDSKYELLLSGETILNGDFGSVHCFREGNRALFDLRDSIKRLAQLPIRLILPAHGVPITNPQKCIDDCLRRINTLIKEPIKMGYHFIRRWFIHALLIRGEMEREKLFSHVSEIENFYAINKRYIKTDDKGLFDELVDDFIERGVVVDRDGKLSVINQL
ncbi:MAG: MBL fold metallo-hydrolase [Desulfobacterales bacterium]|nr:MBL fold metallo-hydrolase [Desulfobacterales bacterium]